MDAIRPSLWVTTVVVALSVALLWPSSESGESGSVVELWQPRGHETNQQLEPQVTEALLDLEVSAELDHAIAMRELARLRTERARRGTHRTEVGVLRARGCLLISAACQSNPLARGCR